MKQAPNIKVQPVKRPSEESKLAPFVLSPEELQKLQEARKKLDLYNVYSSNYLKYYKNHLENEVAILKKNFPGVDFDILARVKSQYSYREKIKSKGEALDIFADKIILKSVNGKTDETLLQEYSYKIQDFLVTYNKSITEIRRKRKDYIKNPKANNYSSLHITRTIHTLDDDENPIEFNVETQIKTFRMRETEKDGKASHFNAYKTTRTCFLTYISTPESAEYYLPKYMHFVFDKSTRSDKLVVDSFDERFRYFFHQSYEDFLEFQKDDLSQDEHP